MKKINEQYNSAKNREKNAKMWIKSGKIKLKKMHSS